MSFLFLSACISFITVFAVDGTPQMSFECGGCVLLIRELEKSIGKVDPSKTISVGSFRVSPDGEQKGVKQINYARSQTYISEILESACDNSNSYKLSVNPMTGKAVFVHKDETYLKGDENSGLRSKLHSACNDLMDSQEDKIINFLGTARDHPVKEFCQMELGVCSSVDMADLPPDEPPVEENDDSLNDEL